MMCTSGKYRKWRQEGLVKGSATLEGGCSEGVMAEGCKMSGEAVVVIPSCYNLPVLLRKAQRAILLFPTLTYGTYHTYF